MWRQCNRTTNEARKLLLLILGLGLLLLIAIPISVTIGAYSQTFIEKAFAHRHINQMQYWETPPHTETKNFEINNSHGPAGNTCWLYGTLILESDLSSDQLTDFYTSRYFPQYYSPTYTEIVAIEKSGMFTVTTETSYFCP